MLKEILIKRILQEGPITFETFMEMALYHPQYGYYRRTDTVIGREGDFYTAPHLSRVFGATIMRQIEEIWEYMRRPDDFIILEMGAGMGYLARDMLDYAVSKDIYNHLQYYIIEINPSLRERQSEILKGHKEKIRWYNSLKEIQPFRGCILSNELLDSFPVHIIVVKDGLKEVYINTDGEGLFEEYRPCPEEILQYIDEFSITLPEGFRTEVNLRIKEWLREISGILKEGFIITIDYGYPAWQYYSEDYPQGTLQCYYRHQKSDNPYIKIGLQDITCHVNFTSLKKWAEEMGFRTIGYTGQGRFIVSMGIEEIIKEIITPDEYPFEVARIKSLLLPSGMGEGHKVMVHYRGSGEPLLRGFRLRNEVSRL